MVNEMKESQKPVRKCHACQLNRGDHCWLYKYPRGQWRGGRTCGAFNAPAMIDALHDWEGAASVMTRKDLRRDVHRQRRHAEAGEGRDWLRKRIRR